MITYIVSVLSHEFLEFPVNFLETDMNENIENKKKQTKKQIVFVKWFEIYVINQTSISLPGDLKAKL